MANPRWLRVGFRVALLLAGPLALCQILSSATPMSIPGLVIAIVASVLTFSIALWPRPWSRFELFIADVDGIAFPASDLLETALDEREDNRWLHVPWANIDAIRVTVTHDRRARCVAFDLKVNAAEQAGFFANVETPADRRSPPRNTLFAAFDLSPPPADRTVAALLALRNRGEAVLQA